MQVVFYNNSSGIEHVHKNLTEIITLDLKLKNSCSVDEPVLLLSGKYLDANYCYIEDFGRYYYRKDVNEIRDGLWEYKFRRDPLMSFKERIKANKAILKRTSQDELANLYIPDERRIVLTETFTRYKKFPNGCFSGIKNSAGNYNFLVLISGVEPGQEV